MYNSSSEALPVASGKKLRSFFVTEIETYLKDHNCSEFDRESLKELITLLHNGVVPNDSTLSLFFTDGKETVDADSVLNVMLTSVPIPDVKVKPNDIFPEEQTRITSFITPNIASVHYNDNDFVSYKQGYIKRAQKSFMNRLTFNVRYGILNKEKFIIYEKDTRDKVAVEIELDKIVSIELMEEEKSIYPFVIHGREADTILGCEDENSRKDWIKRLSSLVVLRMVSAGYINDAEFMKWIDKGANVNACYGEDDPRPILYYLLKYKKTTLANWLIKKGASPNCILRWQFAVTEKVLTPMEILNFIESNNISRNLKSDDGFNYNIMYYMCYFGVEEGVKRLMETNEYQSLLNDPTDSNDIALTITLLSPMTTEDMKVKIASRIYTASNLSICNRSSQNPLQLLMLMGKINLLFKLLPLSMNVREDQFRNSVLHLAIKAKLTGVSRYILLYNNFGDINQLDTNGDSVLSLAIKAGDESLACEIVNEGGDTSICSPCWNFAKSEKDLAIHQALKRKMPVLSNLIMSKKSYFLVRDTEGNLPIHLSLIHHIPQCVQFMLESPAINTFINNANTNDQYTPLHLAIIYGYFEYAEKLLDLGSDLNAQNSMGFTPCHVLVKYARGDYNTITMNAMTMDQIIQLCQDMLKHQPDLTKLCKEQPETCLHMAIRSGEATEELALLFLDYDQSLVKTRDYDRCTPLIRAVEIRSDRLVEKLCNCNAELDVVDINRNTPLHIAVMNGDYCIASYLVDKGSFTRVWNGAGMYPIHIAIQQGNYDILTMLCPYEADANLPTRDGQTPFILACLSGSYDCATFLALRKADPYALDRNDRSCLNIVAAEVRKNRSDMKYAAIARYILQTKDTFSRECFSGADNVREDVEVLIEYVEDAEAQGVLQPEQVATYVPRMSTAAPYDQGYYENEYGEHNPPPPPSSQPPVETLKKFSTLKSVGPQEENFSAEQLIMIDHQRALMNEIEQLEDELEKVRQEFDYDNQELENSLHSYVNAFIQSTKGEKMYNDVVARGLEKGVSEEDAKREGIAVLSNAVKRQAFAGKFAALTEKFENKIKEIQDLLDQKRAELSSIEEQINQ